MRCKEYKTPADDYIKLAWLGVERQSPENGEYVQETAGGLRKVNHRTLRREKGLCYMEKRN